MDKIEVILNPCVEWIEKFLVHCNVRWDMWPNVIFIQNPRQTDQIGYFQVVNEPESVVFFCAISTVIASSDIGVLPDQAALWEAPDQVNDTRLSRIERTVIFLLQK